MIVLPIKEGYSIVDLRGLEMSLLRCGIGEKVSLSNVRSWSILRMQDWVVSKRDVWCYCGPIAVSGLDELNNELVSGMNIEDYDLYNISNCFYNSIAHRRPFIPTNPVAIIHMVILHLQEIFDNIIVSWDKASCLIKIDTDMESFSGHGKTLLESSFKIVSAVDNWRYRYHKLSVVDLNVTQSQVKGYLGEPSLFLSNLGKLKSELSIYFTSHERVVLFDIGRDSYYLAGKVDLMEGEFWVLVHKSGSKFHHNTIGRNGRSTKNTAPMRTGPFALPKKFTT